MLDPMVVKRYMKENNIEVLDDIDIEIIQRTEPQAQQYIKIDNYQENAERFYLSNPFFYDKARIWWLWNVDHYEIVDETTMGKLIDQSLGFCGQTISANVRGNYLEAMKRTGRDHIPKDAPSKWIQFKDKAYSLISKNIYTVQPNFFFTNPIPWEIGETEDTPVMDKLFTEWVGQDHIQTMYEIIAYCTYSQYPIHTLFCLYGMGRNGKDCFLRLLTNFIGVDNVCSTDLDLIAGNNRSRFESAKMFKKLVCQMGETNFGILQNSNTLKQLTGASLMNYELKGKDGFSGYNYAKLLIASNSLPTTLDTTDGFFSRWVIIDFPNRFPEGKDILATIPEEEYRNLAKKVCRILPEILERGNITNQGTIEDRKKRYIMASNPLPVFIEKYCKKDVNGAVRQSEFYANYCSYLNRLNKRVVSSTELAKLLASEGFEIRRTTKKVNTEWISDRWIEGLEFTDEHRLMTLHDGYDALSTPTPYTGDRVGMVSLSTLSTLNLPQNPQIVEESVYSPKISNDSLVNSTATYLPCHICGNTTSIGFDTSPQGKGRPICSDCFKLLTKKV